LPKNFKSFEPFLNLSCLNASDNEQVGDTSQVLGVPANVLTDDSSDSDLVDKCLKGDSLRDSFASRTCFRHLYQRYQHKVRSTLYQLCGSSLLDDLTQEVFLRVWKGLPKLKQQENFSTWLYRITWNVASDQRQAFAKQHSFDSKLQNQETMDRVIPNNNTSDLMQLHYQDLVQRGLEQLSFDHRSVLVLHDLEDIPQKEVAQILGLPMGTVKSRVFYARNSVRQFLQKQGVYEL
jgi:RNA polymerase sigma-70 factor, ECF subfamily